MLPIDVDRIECINLNRRLDRWGECATEFDKWGLDVGRIAPVPHSNPDESLARTLVKTLDEARTDNLKRVLILEDDVEFVGLDSLPEPPKDFDLYYLGFTYHILPNTSHAELTGRRWLRLARSCHGLFAVVYSNKIFLEIIDGLLNRPATCDRWMADTFQPRGKVYCSNPPVAIVRNSASDISPEPYRQKMREVVLGQYNQAASKNGWKQIIA